MSCPIGPEAIAAGLALRERVKEQGRRDALALLTLLEAEAALQAA